MRKQELKYIVLGLLEKNLNYPVVVLESDDWGAFRIPSNEVYSELEKKGIQLNFPGADYYNLYDTLESKQDLELLFEVLSAHKDSEGNSAILTPLSLCANPNFTKIRENGYSKYEYFNLAESLDYYQRDGVLNLYKEGINNRLFLPQFHGREHLNVPVWMRALSENIGDARTAFDYEVWGHINTHPNNIFYQAAFELEYESDLEVHKKVIQDGLNLFETTFGYKAQYFVPPNGPMNNKLYPILADNGISLISSDIIQLESLGNQKFKRHFRYLGKKNKFDQKYIKRNCFFEPSAEGKDWVDSCLSEIEMAFKFGKPAIISTHRVNFIGGLSPQNRANGLKKLDDLLKQITQKWPNVVFKTTPELYDLI